MHKIAINRCKWGKKKKKEKRMIAYNGTSRHFIVCYKFATKEIINKWPKNKERSGLNWGRLTQQFKRSN